VHLDMEVMDHRSPKEIEEVLTEAEVASPPPLPVADVAESVFDRDALAQLGATGWGLLPCPKFLEQGLIGVHADAAAVRAGGAAGPHGAGGALVDGKVHGGS